MNRIDATLRRLTREARKVLSPYITAGDPSPEHTVKLMHALVKSGADILEIGIPFSDPMAEGDVIQAAMERALSFNVTINDILQMVATFREQDKVTPIILMGYVNPFEYYGYEQFAEKATVAGVDGTIIVDMPPEEGDAIMPIWEKYNLYSIYLCSPTTSEIRMAKINKYAKGYLYYVSLKGVTGSDAINLASVEQHYQQRKSQTSLPIMVGFGIKTPETAAKVAQFADGVIVGAALINTIIEAYKANQNCETAGASLIHNYRRAMDNI